MLEIKKITITEKLTAIFPNTMVVNISYTTQTDYSIALAFSIYNKLIIF